MSLIMFASNIQGAYIIGRTYFGNAKAVKKCLEDKRFALSACREGEPLQRFAVAGNHGFVPLKAFLTGAGHVAGAVVVLVDVDKAVALAVLAGGEGDAVNAAPRV